MIGFLDNEAGAPHESTAQSLWNALQLAERCFAPGGFLQTQMGLAHRPQQDAMAAAVAAALTGDTSLLAEAGTGVGKSLAYLIPGILVACASRRPLVVSTHTIALQQQLLQKDIPLCRTLFEKTPELGAFADFKTALLMGRANYLCTTRLGRAIETKQDLFSEHEQDELLRIVEWATTTQTGLLEELSPTPSPEIWEWVNADSNVCTTKRCGCDACFYQRARALAAKAQVRIVNHSLLFALIGAGAGPQREQRGILFPDDRVILDEAHLVPDTATEYFGEHLSSHGIDRWLRQLYNSKTRRGLLKRVGTSHDCDDVTRLIALAQAFFEKVKADHLSKQDCVRLYAPEWGSLELLGPLATLANRIGALISSANSENDADELRDWRARLTGLRATLESMLFLAERDDVHWLELSGKKKNIVHVHTAPVDVSEHLRRCLFSRQTSAVLTSATLSVGDDMEHFKARVGGDGQETLRENSPFDYEKNMRVFIAADAPSPEAGNGAIDRAFLADNILHCACAVKGGTLVLFTSHQDMKAVADILREGLQKAGRALFVQGEELSRPELVKRFAACGNGVLFGTDSFWTGVDIPGPALSQVIITRLPFENPSDPLLEARCEWVRDRGGQPFADITLPEALLKFRQGLGRLIRKETDRGTLVILDARILSKPYGGRFLAALPQKEYAAVTKANRAQIFKPLD